MPIPMVASPLFSILASKTYNAAWYSGATNNDKINAAIAAATADGALYVAIPASLLPHTVALSAFGTILPITEGRNTDHRILVGNDPFLTNSTPFAGIAVNIQPSVLTLGSAADVRAIYISYNSALSNVQNSEVYGIQINSAMAGSTATIINAFGIRMDLSKPAGATISGSFWGLRIGTINGASTANYGIELLDITGTNAFAIKTGLGKVSLGDELFIPASTTSRASMNMPHGSAPSAPVNGDIWTTTAGLFVRINGVTVGPLT